MVNLNKKKSKRIFILFSLTVLLGITSFNFSLFDFSSITDFDDSNSTNDFMIFNKLKTADITSFNGTGKQINITLHQSYLNSSFNTVLNLSDSNDNKFNLPCPTDTSFNSSYTKFEVENIFAPNKSLVVEDDSSGQDTLDENYYTSFRVPTDCYLTNLSIELLSPISADIFYFDIFGALNHTDGNPKFDTSKDLTGLGPRLGQHTNDSLTPVWFTLTGLDQFLDVSETHDNYFFIKVSTENAQGMWRYESFIDGDETYSYKNSQSNHLTIIDYTLKVGLRPVGNNIANASDINLKISNTNVTDITDGQGYWESTEVNSSATGELEYIVTADWWNVTCNISQVQINYTKTDLSANSEFNIAGSNQIVEWNATRNGGLNFFDSDFGNYEINFTVPANWKNLQAFNGITNKTDDTILSPIVGGYKTLQIINAGNGAYWFINGTSNNLLQKIQTSVSSIEKEIVNFTDTVSFFANFTETIINGNINLTVYSPTPGDYSNHTYANNSLDPNSQIPLLDWTISSTAEDNYGDYKVQVYWNNDTAAGFLEKDLTIMAVTDLLLVSPQSGEEYLIGETFDIAVFYNDTGYNVGDKGIADATVIEDSGFLTGPTPNGTDGYYIYNLDTNDYSSGWNTINFEANKTYHNNDSCDFTFYLRVNTTIAPSNTKDFGDVIKGDSRTYVFNYSDINLNPIEGAVLSEVSLPPGFGRILTEVSLGNYSIELDTSGVTASVVPYTCIFNITAPRNETQYIYLTLTVTIAQTSIDILSVNDTLVRKDGLNQTVLFSFNDTDNNIGIPGLDVSNVTVIDNQTLNPRPIWLYPTATQGEYILNVSISGLDSGWIEFVLNASLPPDYNWSTNSFKFYLIGNTSQIHLISMTDLGGEGLLTGVGDSYTCFFERDLYLTMNITDSDNGDTIVTGDADLYQIDYLQIGNLSNSGALGNTLDFVIASNTYRGDILSSNLVIVGTYSINVTIKLTNYEETIYSFNLTLKAKYSVNISVIQKPIEITAGDSFNITLGFEYFNGTDWVILEGANVRIVPYFDGSPATPTSFFPTDISGEVFIPILSRSDARNMTLVVELQGSYYHVADSLDISDITVKVPSSGLALEDFIPYLIIIGVALAVVVGSIGIYRGVVVPKKREKSRVLKEVKTIFDDAISLEHILVLYKGTGTCIYFKSFGSEGIDPELISGFISAICSFGKDLVCQEELNEITYGDKMLLLSDGEYIRVALVLSKKASVILRKNLMDFINTFEKSYVNELPNWRGQLNIFRKSGLIVDEILSTSIILPHEITYDHSNVKALKNPHSKDVLKVTNNMMKESDRNFFFIATLLKESAEKTNKDTAEIFMGIKELRDKKILIPIEIGAIEAQPISQQEMTLINQKIGALTHLSQEEKQKLANDLAQLGPAEREAYFVSLSERHEIVSAPIEEKPGTTLIDNMKGAKKEIKNLKKVAKDTRKEKDYMKTINIYQNATRIAVNWELMGELEQLNELIRLVKIEDLSIKMKTLEKEAKLAAKKENYREATQKYKMSSRIASEIFKLGGTEMTKEVKRLSNKSKEYEKLI